MKESTEKNNSIEQAIVLLDKKYGRGTVMRLGEKTSQDIGVIPTGALGIDLALGCGGYPLGRVVEIYGPESSGKTTLALLAIAECQATGGSALFIDAEHAFDPSYANALGVDMKNLLVSQPDDGEQALQIAEQMINSAGLDLIVIDSVAALVPRSELNGDMGEIPIGLQARLMSQALRKLTGVACKNNTCVIFINQLRQKIGISFGPSEVTTGGNALKFYASVRIDIRRIGSIKQNGEATGNRTRVKIVKNKLAPPFRQVELDIVYGHGISKEKDILELAEKFGLVERSGSWFSCGDKKLGQGKEQAAAMIQSHPELREKLRKDIIKKAAA